LEDDVRVTTAFNRLLALQGARVIDVLFGPDGVTVRVALRATASLGPSATA